MTRCCSRREIPAAPIRRSASSAMQSPASGDRGVRTTTLSRSSSLEWILRWLHRAVTCIYDERDGLRPPQDPVDVIRAAIVAANRLKRGLEEEGVGGTSVEEVGVEVGERTGGGGESSTSAPAEASSAPTISTSLNLTSSGEGDGGSDDARVSRLPKLAEYELRTSLDGGASAVYRHRGALDDLAGAAASPPPPSFRRGGGPGREDRADSFDPSATSSPAPVSASTEPRPSSGSVARAVAAAVVPSPSPQQRRPPPVAVTAAVAASSAHVRSRSHPAACARTRFYPVARAGNAAASATERPSAPPLPVAEISTRGGTMRDVRVVEGVVVCGDFAVLRPVGACDVLLGRGGAIHRHAGNRRFRSLVASRKAEFFGASKKTKTAISREIVQTVLAEWGGAFLRRLDDDDEDSHEAAASSSSSADGDGGGDKGPSERNKSRWIAVEEETARKKTSHLLRARKGWQDFDELEGGCISSARRELEEAETEGVPGYNDSGDRSACDRECAAALMTPSRKRTRRQWEANDKPGFKWFNITPK